MLNIRIVSAYLTEVSIGELPLYSVRTSETIRETFDALSHMYSFIV
jgi:hypothetical protein